MSAASLAERRGLRLFTFCVLYCAQGIPWGFMAITLPTYLAGRGLDASAIGTILAMTVAPYGFKIVWGPVIDALPFGRWGKRTPWIVFAQAMMAITVGTLALIPDLTADVHLLAIMIFVHTVFNSIQDVATDALAVDLLDEDERGRTNGMMYGSKYFGGVLGGAGMSMLIGRIGLRGALVVQGAVLLAIMLVPLLVRERPADPDAARAPVASLVQRWRAWLGELGAAFVFRGRALRSVIVGAAMMFASNLASGLLAVVAPVLFTQQLGWTPDDYADLTGGPGLLVGLGGSVLGGFLADRVGHKRLAAIGAASLGAFWVVWAALAHYWGSHALVYALFAIEPLCQSVTTVSLFAICMDISSPKIAATQFGTYMALANWSTTTGAKLAGVATDTWTVPGLYLIAAALQVALIASLAFVDTRAVRQQLAEA